jgi:RNA-directed DNA polymerase
MQIASRSDLAKDTEVMSGAAGVVGGRRLGKGACVNAGSLPGEDLPKEGPADDRVAIVARKPGNAGGAKGDRKANSPAPLLCEYPPSEVPATDKQEGEELWQRHKAERAVWSERMLIALERGIKGNRWFSLIDKVHGERTLARAWEKVRSNAGACGVDGITVEHFLKDSHHRLLDVKEHLKEGTYQPKPVKRTYIKKPGSKEKRPLGIPTVRDRVVQSAVRMVIEPIFEQNFAPASYGFRPGRSCKDALREVDRLLHGGYTQVVDIDIKGYFDSIDHARLMTLVSRRIADGRVLGLIEMFLGQGIFEGMELWEPEEGTPQGGPLSPLLANIYLDPLDWLMAEAGIRMVRYADDIVVLARSAEEAAAALERVRGWMAEAGLTLHPEKTRMVDMDQIGSHFDFLGFRFWRGKSGKLRRFIRPKSKQKFKERLRPLTKRANGHSLPVIIARLNESLRGYYGYFKHACGDALNDVDQWVRGRLRSILRKRSKRRGRARGQDHQR